MTKISELELGGLEELILSRLQREKYPLSLRALKKMLEDRIGGRVSLIRIKEALSELRKRGFDVKKVIVGGEEAYYLVRYGKLRLKDYYRLAGKIRTPFIASSDWHVGCLRGDALVGLGRPISEYKKGEKVLSNSLTEIRATMKRSPIENEKLIRIKPMSILPVEVTGKHPVLIAPNKGRDHSRTRISPREEELCFVNAEDLEEGDWVVLPRIGKEVDTIKLREQETHRSRTEFKVEELAEFLGFYVADGYVQNNRDRTIGLCFNALKEASLAERWKSFIERTFGKKVSVVRGENSIQLRFCFKALAEYLSKLGKARSKRVPEEILLGNEKAVRAFLKGYFDGDGCLLVKHGKDSYYSATTTSKILAYQFPLLTAKIGLLPNIQRGKSVFKGKYNGELYHIELFFNPKRPRYRVTQKYIFIPIVKLEREPLRESVYNLETENNIFACPILVHNSRGFSEQAFYELVDNIREENIRDLIIAGDLLQGLGVYRTEREDLTKYSIDEQVEEAIDYLREIPSKVRIHTIMGGHEQKIKGVHMVGFDALEAIARRLKNVNYYGYTANLELDRKYRVLVIHGRGGRSYASSYSIEKFFDSLVEKPHILILGHFHEMDLIEKPPYYKLIKPGCLQRESIYVLSKGLTSQVGWYVIEEYSEEKAIIRSRYPKVY